MIIDNNHPIRSEANRASSHSRSLNTLLGVIFPIILAGSGVATPALWNEFGFITLLLWVGIIATYFYVWRNAQVNEGSVIALTVELSDAHKNISDLQSELEYYEHLTNSLVWESYSAFALRQMTAQYAIQGIPSIDDLNEALGEMLSPLYLDGGETLGLEASEKWGIAVYLYSGKQDKLILVWREKSRNHPSAGEGRAWGRGEGHVGKAFVNGKPLVTRDASHQDVVQLCSAPSHLERDYDEKAYRSFASIPIGPVKDEPFPYGVLVGTSDHVGRFDGEKAKLMKHFADSIAVMIGLNGIDFDCIAESTDTCLTKGDSGYDDDAEKGRTA